MTALIHRFASASGKLHFTALEDLAITVVADDIDDDEWEAMLQWVTSTCPNRPGNLAYQVRGSISTKQRQRAHDVGKGYPLERVALLTDSALVRGTLTATSWLRMQTKYRAFRTGELDPALDWLREVIAFDRADAAREFVRICGLLGIGASATAKAG
jgi:hypothetical protein